MRSILLFKLALKDLIRDRRVSFFIISALIAVIAPLLLLFSLKFGIVFKLKNDLRNDPQNLEIRISGGNYHIDETWIKNLKQHEWVSFVIPTTRALNMQASIKSTESANHYIESLELLPTDTGDPLIPSNIRLSADNHIILSRKAANKLNVEAGDKVKLFFQREILQQGRTLREKISVELNVEGILEERYFEREGGFVSLPLLIEMEDFIDGYQISRFVVVKTGISTAPPRERFAKARLYAKDLDSVPLLSEWLNKKGISTLTKAQAIANVKAIDNVLTAVFGIIAITSIVGVIMSLFGSFLANIDRKRKEIALLRLFGFRQWELRFYLLIQSLILSTLALIFSIGLYFISSFVINYILGQNLAEKEFISHLFIDHFIFTFFITNLTACIVALIGGLQITKIQPAEVLREV